MAPPVVPIEGLGRHVDTTVRVRGWLNNRRSKGKIHFLELRDGTGFVQAVMGVQDVPKEVFDRCAHLPYESSLTLVGKVRTDHRAPGGVELLATDVDVHHAPLGEYPISKKEHGPDFLLSHRHLWIRSRKQHATLRIRDSVITAIRNFFHDRGFICLDAPIFTPSACEGTTNLFEVKYFDSSAYLSQSGQLYMEAGATAFGKVYCFGPTFRAEKSKTRRHLTEFWMVEPEVAYADLDDIMQLAEDLVVDVVGYVLKHRQQELKTLGREISRLEAISPPFPRMQYDEAIALLRTQGRDFEWGSDFGAPDETALSEAHDTPLFVHRFPAKVKAFYMKREPQNHDLSLSVDLLAPEGVGEIIGGGQREDDLSTLEQAIEEHDLPKDAFEWFADLRRFGSVPHAGFGLGLERTVAWICGTEHVRECIPFPRTLYRMYP